MHRPSTVAGASLLALALVLVGCSGEDPPAFGTGEVVPARVTQTVAAAAVLEPQARVTVDAPAGGDIAELFVADGDVVDAGDPVARLASDSIDLQVAQAESAVEAADAFAQAASGAGLDVAPLVGAFRSQLDAVFPPIIDALGDQLGLLEAALAELQAIEVPTIELPEPPQLPELPAPPDGLELPEGLEDLAPPGDGDGGDDGDAGEATDEGESPDDADAADPLVDTSELEAAIADATARLERTEADYRAAARDLEAAESELSAGSDEAAEGQAAAAQAQRDQAELALEAARSRIDDLTVLAPADGVVELARGDDGATAGLDGLPDGLGDGADDLGAGELGDVGELGDLGGLLGGDATSSGPIAEGVSVGPGQTLVTIYDLSAFTAEVNVDEIDVVEVEEGQDVTVLIDAFPDVELAGVVAHVAIAPRGGTAGGAIFPVTVELLDVPDEVGLRVGLTASAEIAVREVDADTVVPTGALLRRGDAEVVHVVRDGTAVAVPVDVLAIGEEDAAVDGDLEAGEVVVTSGVESVEDGMEIDLEEQGSDG